MIKLLDVSSSIQTTLTIVNDLGMNLFLIKLMSNSLHYMTLKSMFNSNFYKTYILKVQDLLTHTDLCYKLFFYRPLHTRGTWLETMR